MIIESIGTDQTFKIDKNHWYLNVKPSIMKQKCRGLM